MIHNSNNITINNNCEIFIDLLLKLHNKIVIENHNKFMEKLHSNLREKKYGFQKLNKIAQFYLIKLAVSELIKFNQIDNNSNYRSYEPSTDDIVEELKAMKVQISKTTLNRWIREHFVNIHNLCEQIINHNLLNYFRNSQESPNLNS